jgi:hypothetical protein
LLSLTLLIIFYGYIPIVFDFLLSYSVVTPPHLLLSFGGVTYEETFNPVIKHVTIQVVLSIATSQEWPIHQLDVKNAFLHGNLVETVFTQQPTGFVSSVHPDYVCQLHKSLYGLKQAPCTWFLCFTSILSKLGFLASKSDSSLFVLHRGHSTAYLLLYVNDIILTTNSSQML